MNAHGALELGDLVARTLVWLIDKDAESRVQAGYASSSSKRERHTRAKRVSPADESGGAP